MATNANITTINIQALYKTLLHVKDFNKKSIEQEQAVNSGSHFEHYLNGIDHGLFLAIDTVEQLFPEELEEEF